MTQDPQLRLEAALTTPPDAPDPDWYAITNRIFWGAGGGDVTVTTGRQTELADIDPSRLALGLKNNDGALTPRNPLAPAPFLGNWETGKRIRLTELFAPDSVDTFGRTVTDHWGTDDTGLGYDLYGAGGTLAYSDFNVSGGAGRLLLPVANSFRAARPEILTGMEHLEVLAAVSLPAVPTGASIDAAEIQFRYEFDPTMLTERHYTFVARVSTSGAITATIRWTETPTTTPVKSFATGLTYTPGTRIWVRGKAVGPELSLRVWLDGQSEPTTWTVQVTDGTSDLAGEVRYRSSALSGNTNVPFQVSWHHQELRELFPLFTGHLEMPEVKVGLPGIDQPCSVSAIDRLGRLNSISPFEGNLAEFIPRHGHPAGGLRLHLPLSDAAGPWMAKNLPQVTELHVGGNYVDEAVPKEPDELITAATTEGPPGDDQSYATWEPAFNAEGDLYLGYAWLTLPVSIDVGPTDTIAVSAWWKPRKEPNAPNQPALDLFDLYGDFDSLASGTYGALHFNIDNNYEVAGPDVVNRPVSKAYFGDGAGGLLLTSPSAQWDVWRLVTLRMNLATKLVELMIGNLPVVSGTASDVTVGPNGFRMRFLMVGDVCGSIAHLQIRAGANVMTWQQHLAQYEFGYKGLQGQAVADRVATVAGYAGVPAAYLKLDKGASTPLQKISMAGKKPATLMTDATRTGQDLLLADPVGRIVLVPRQTRYNQPVAASIPFGWLTRGSVAWRFDQPITEATATRTGRGSVRKTNDAAADRYGTRAQPYRLDTAVDADPGNLAAWTVRVYDRIRTRLPALRINMRNRTVEERKALLRLRVGDRIQLTGLPVDAPDDAGDLVIQGVKHTCGKNRRVIEFNTSPVLGAAPGLAPYCPVVGVDVIGPNTRLAY